MVISDIYRSKLAGVKTALGKRRSGPVAKSLRNEVLVLTDSGVDPELIAKETGINRQSIERWQRDRAVSQANAMDVNPKPRIFSVEQTPVLNALASPSSLQLTVGEFVITIASRQSS